MVSHEHQPVCAQCGAVGQVVGTPAPGGCPGCGRPLAVRETRAACRNCGAAVARPGALCAACEPPEGG